MKQRGIVLLLAMAVLMVSGTYFFVSSPGISRNRIERDRITEPRLATNLGPRGPSMVNAASRPERRHRAISASERPAPRLLDPRDAP